MTGIFNYQQQQQNQQPWLQQQQNPTPAGAANNMVRALMAGNDQYNQSMANQNTQGLAQGMPVPGAMGPSAVGGPEGPVPIQGDPTMQALMSPIPM